MELAEPVFDRAEAIARLDGNEELFAEMARMFLVEHAAYAAALKDALASRDAASLRREAHTAKSLLATFSCNAGRDLALRLELLAASGNIEGAAALTAEVVASMERLAAALRTD
jgi:HPt (histidine-containing phosphotransfer) domain-containing protein